MEYFYLEPLTTSQQLANTGIKCTRAGSNCLASQLSWVRGHQAKDGPCWPPTLSICAHAFRLAPTAEPKPSVTDNDDNKNTLREEYGFDLGKNHKLWDTSAFTHRLPLYILFICLLPIKTQLPPHSAEERNYCSVCSGALGWMCMIRIHFFQPPKWQKLLFYTEKKTNNNRDMEQCFGSEAMPLHCSLLLLPLTPVSKIC